MINKLIALLLVILLPATSALSQNPSAKARAEILMLKDGAFLIKLKTSENVINALMREGKTNEAEKIRNEQATKNKEIAGAFSSKVNFCKVFFFYAGNTAAIKNGDFGTLMNGSLESDSTFNSVNYLIGEFGESSTNKIDGFIIEDRNLEQLKDPFPSFIRTNKAGVNTRSYEEIAEELNNQLYEFYNKVK